MLLDAQLSEIKLAATGASRIACSTNRAAKLILGWQRSGTARHGTVTLCMPHEGDGKHLRFAEVAKSARSLRKGSCMAGVISRALVWGLI